MATHNINGVKIHTSFDYPPIPIRDMDWSAVLSIIIAFLGMFLIGVIV